MANSVSKGIIDHIDNVIWIVLAFFFFVWVFNTISGRNYKPTEAKSSSPAILRTGVTNGFDPETKTIINPINIFKDYENRNLGISGKVGHGERVTIMERSGNGLKIYTNSGVTGWVSKEFVKED
jgi:hypothetical protein